MGRPRKTPPPVRPRFAVPRRGHGPDETVTDVTLGGNHLGYIVGRPHQLSIRKYTVIMLGIVIATRFDYSSARAAFIEEWERHQ